MSDELRRNDLDRRGNLFNEGFIEACRFFLDVCLDQVEYMGGLLESVELIEHIRFARINREKSYGTTN